MLFQSTLVLFRRFQICMYKPNYHSYYFAIVLINLGLFQSSLLYHSKISEIFLNGIKLLNILNIHFNPILLKLVELMFYTLFVIGKLPSVVKLIIWTGPFTLIKLELFRRSFCSKFLIKNQFIKRGNFVKYFSFKTRLDYNL